MADEYPIQWWEWLIFGGIGTLVLAALVVAIVLVCYVAEGN